MSVTFASRRSCARCRRRRVRGRVEGATVGEVLDALDAEHPVLRERLSRRDGGLRRFVNVYVGDEDVRFRAFRFSARRVPPSCLSRCGRSAVMQATGSGSTYDGRLTGMAARGVRISVDDFGTGYSSLSQLARQGGQGGRVRSSGSRPSSTSRWSPRASRTRGPRTTSGPWAATCCRATCSAGPCPYRRSRSGCTGRGYARRADRGLHSPYASAKPVLALGLPECQHVR
jgi:hypothetical protein